MSVPDLPRCSVSDLPRILCHHCDSFTLTSEEQAYLRGEFGSADVPAGRGPTRVVRITYTDGEWGYGGQGEGVGQTKAKIPAVLVCDHDGRPPGSPDLCQSCQEAYRRALGDVPAVLDDLIVALTKQAVFLEQGAPSVSIPEEEYADDFTGPYTEEGEVPFHIAAGKALRRLQRALGTEPIATSRRLLQDWRATMRRPDLAEHAAAVTGAIAQAHGVIDRPATLLDYGVCPKCHNRIKHERVDPHDPDGRIECPCGYVAPLDQHQRAQLEVGEDQHYTVTELLRVLEQGGEPARRHEIDNLIHRHGLPREKGQRTRWRKDALERYEVDVYRLGDVRAMLAERRGKAS